MVCPSCPREGDTHGHLPCPSSWGFGHSLRPPALMTQTGHLLRALGRRGLPQLLIRSRGSTSSRTSLDLLSLRGQLCYSHSTDEQTEARSQGTGPRPQRHWTELRALFSPIPGGLSSISPPDQSPYCVGHRVRGAGLRRRPPS